MKYAAHEKISFDTLEAFSGNAWTLFDHLLTTMRFRLRDEAVGTYNADTLIRPWPRGSDQPVGLEFLMEVVT